MTDTLSERTDALLRGLLKDEGANLVALFAPGAVRVVLTSEAAFQSQAQLIVSFLVNLLTRLHPVVQSLEVVLPSDVPLMASAPRWRAATFNAHLVAILQGVRSEVAGSLGTKASSAPMHTVCVGGGHDKAQLFVGSVGWRVELDVNAPCSAEGAPNPVGAYSAACMAAAEIWKLALSERPEFSYLPIFPLTTRLSFSTFSLLVGEDTTGPELPQPIDLPNLSFIGAGAGGGAILFTLASLEDLTGSMTVVDPDVVEGSNLNRYVFADRHDAEAKRDKPAVIETLFQRFPNLRVTALAKPFEQVAKDLSYEYVVAAVHSRTARRDIQTETPKVLWDCAASGDGEFRVWRHLLGRSDCMWCKHPIATDPERQKAAQLQELVGLESDVWESKIRNNAPFTSAEIAILRIPVGSEITLPETGERFDDWERRQCGKMHLPELNAEIPIPFAPVMAGVLIAGEIIKELYFPTAVLDSYYWNTLTGQFMRRKKPEHRSPTPGCPLCQKPAYRAQYARRWGVAL